MTACEPERFLSPEYLNVLDPAQPTAQLFIPPHCLAEMRSAAEAGYPLEVCGLLIGNIVGDDWHVQQIRPVANLNRERAADRFQLDPEAYRQIDRELRHSPLEIVGVYHSHPDCPAKPSPTDLASSWEGFAYPIISTRAGHAAEIRCWSVNDASSRFHEISIAEQPL